jgi:hypothetical protein
MANTGYSGGEASAWQQIAASTTRDHFAFVPSFQPCGGDTTLTPVKNCYVDLGLGSAAAEDFIGGAEQSYLYRYDTTEFCEGPWNSYPTFADVPSGTRLAMRVSMSGATDATNPECAIHCVS